MEVYFGGAYQGKLDYVCSKKNMSVVADGADCNIEDLENAEILNHMHLLIKRYVKEGKSTDTLIDSLYDINLEIIIICDEVGSGIVPLEKRTEYTGKQSDAYFAVQLRRLCMWKE